MVLIPGEGLGAWAWFRQVPAIKRLAQIVVFDPRGVGESHSHEAHPEAGVETMARDVVGLMQSLGLAKATVVGADVGGFVALQLALERPEMVDRLVLLSTAATGREDVFLSEEARRLRAETAGMSLVDRFRHDLGLQVAPGFTGRNPGLLDGLVDNYRKQPPDAEALNRQRERVEGWDVRGELSRVKAPVLVVGGSGDRYQEKSSLEYLGTAIGEARLEWVANAGHIPHLERPDIVNRLVMSFAQEEDFPAAAAERWRTFADGSRPVAEEDWDAEAAPAQQLVPLPKVLERRKSE